MIKTIKLTMDGSSPLGCLRRSCKLINPYAQEAEGCGWEGMCIIVESACCTLFESSLSWTFWTKAVFLAVYIENPPPTKVAVKKTSFAVFLGRKLGLPHLCVLKVLLMLMWTRRNDPSLTQRALDAFSLDMQWDSRDFSCLILSQRECLWVEKWCLWWKQASEWFL